jgi:hypothetical protein
VSRLGFSIELERGEGGGNPPGTRAFVTRMNAIEWRAHDVSPALQQIRKSFYAAERRRFATLGAGEWAPNAPSTLRRKARHGQDLRPMRATGALYRALTTGHGVGAVNKVSRDEMTLGVRMKKAAVAQRGSGRRRRRLIAINRQTRTRWTKILRDHVMGADDKP